MISLSDVDVCYDLDLYDDFTMNYKQKLYDFIGGDIVKAFRLGLHVQEWFQKLEKEQQYLHSKALRHNEEIITKHKAQITYWSNKFFKDESEEKPLIDFTEYLVNNLICDHEDIVKIALHYGLVIATKNEESKEDE